MVGAQKDERKENRGDGRFIQRMYMRSGSDTTKMGGYTESGLDL